MSKNSRFALSIALLSVFGFGSAPQRVARAQGSRADFERAESLESLTRNQVFGQVVDPGWIEGRPLFWYRVTKGPDQSRFILVDAERGERRDAFDHARLAEALAEAIETEVSPQQLPFRRLEFSPDASRIRFRAAGRHWEWHLADSQLSVASDAARESSAVRRLDRVRRSRDRGGETTVQFVNRTDQPVRLLWIDRSGKRVDYGQLEPGGERDQSTYAGHVWLVASEDDQPLAVFQATDEFGVAVVGGGPPAGTPLEPLDESDASSSRRDAAVSPDGKWRATIRDFNLWLVPTGEGHELQLSHNGCADDAYGDRIFWSPDSAKLVAIQEQAGDARKIVLVESSPQDQLQPRLQEIRYPKPGDQIEQPRPRLFDVTQAKEVPISQELFANPWSISEVRWSSMSDRFTFLYNQRGHQAVRIVAVDASTGDATALIDEKSETFIDYAHKLFTHYLDPSAEIIWMSERDGWNHLYLYDANHGVVKQQITQGPWVVRQVDHVDAEARQIWFFAGGVYPDQDPYYLHYCRVDFDGNHFVVLTQGDGTHDVERSPDGAYLIDRYSRVDLPPVVELRRAADGRLICELERADASALSELGWKPPIRFVAPGRDHETAIYGVLYFPWNSTPDATYPVIEKIYAGPHGSFVPKAFSSYANEQAVAELGFVVVQIDGMGTSHRSKRFHDVCWKNLADAGLPDRIAWLQAAALAYPSLDLNRVGIYGGSAGGQSALRAMLDYPDFYRVGVADCGCHDNRMDKIWWNELWMGWPIGPHYAAQSNATDAHRLQGKLLLTVGELDRNVDPASTMQVVRALIAADKNFELIVFPGEGHGIGESQYGRRRRREFFVRHLLGVEPRWE